MPTRNINNNLTVFGDGAEMFLKSADHNVARIIPRGTGSNLDKGLLSLFDTGTEDVRIDTAGNSWFNGGNIGIGQGSPTAKLHLKGDGGTSGLTFKTTDHSDNEIFYVMDGGRVGVRYHPFSIGIPSTTSLATNAVFQVEEAGLLTVLSTGKVGVGITNPAKELDVVGTVRACVDASGDQHQLRPTMLISYGTDAIVNAESAGDDVRLNTQSNTVLIAKAEGNVGIGINSPTQKLQVAGNALLANGSADVNLYLGNTSYGLNLDYSAGDIFVRTNGANRMCINNSGKVLVNGAHDNGGKADFAVDGGTQISLYDGQVQMGGSDMNWNSKFVYDGRTNLAAWDNDIKFFIQGSNTGSASARDIYFCPQTSGTGAATERMRIKGDGNVGIGTTNPQASLHVAGYLGTTPTGNGVLMGLYTTGSSNYGNIQLNGDTGSFIDFSSSGTDWKGRILYDNSSNYMRFDTGGTERMRINSSGNVGIGTTSPNVRTEIAASVKGDPVTSGTTQTYGALRVRGSATNVLDIGQQSASPYGMWMQVCDSTSLGTEYPLLLNPNGGSVGIGTTAPEDKLDIVGGNLRISSNRTANTNKTNRIRGEHYNIAEEPHTFMFMNSFSTSNQLHIGGGSSVENAATSLRFFTAANNTTVAGTERMRITSAGNVGIGTTNPIASYDKVLNIQGSNPTVKIQTTSSSGWAYNQYVSPEATWSAGILDTDRYVISQSASLGTNVRFTIDDATNGNVGIGILAPTFKLHVKSDDANDDIAYIHHDNPSQSSGTVLKVRSDAGDSSGYSLLDVSNSSGTAFYVRGDRNVGIGTTSPADRLHLGASSNLLFERGGELRSKDTGGGVRTITRVNSANELEYGWSGAGPVKFMGGGSYAEKMRIHTNGNVGIGTTSPNAKLEVTGNIEDNWAGRFENTNSGGYGILAKIAGTSANERIFEARVGTSTKMLIDGTGNTTFSGNIIATEGLFGATGTAAPDRRIWSISTHYNDWGIFYNEGSPDAIEFKSAGNVKAKINLDDGKIYAEGSNRVFHDGYHPNADALTTARTISLSGDVTGSVSFNGSSNVSITTAVANDSHTHDGRYYTESEVANHFKTLAVQGNFMNTYSWSGDTVGSANNGWSDLVSSPFSGNGSYGQNGTDAENSRSVESLPSGAKGVVWQTPSNDSTSNGDGGWNCTINGVDSTKAYRSVIYFKPTDDSNSGTFYHGCHGSHTLNLNTSANTNPYFHNIGYSNFVQDRWYVSIGYIQPYQSSGGTSSIKSGIYDCTTGKKVFAGSDFMMKSGSTLQQHRTYLYYSTDTATSIEFYGPRFEEVNGNEPSTQELVNKGLDGLAAMSFHSKYDPEALTQLTESSDANDDKFLLWDESASEWKYMRLDDLQDSIDNNTTYSVGDGGLTQKNFTTTLKEKLDGISDNADVTPSWVPSSNPNYLTSSSTQSKYLRSDASDSFTGTLTGGTLHAGGEITASSAKLQVKGFQRTGTIYLHEGTSAGANNYPLATTSGGELQWNTNKLWHAGNDGSGSGLDADLLDGIDSTRFIYGDNATGTSSISGSEFNPTGHLKSGFYRVAGSSSTIPNATSNNFVLHTSYNSVGNKAGFDLAVNDSTSSKIYFRPSTGGGRGSWQTIWTDASDGSGSGLDADTLDGYEGSYYATTNDLSGKLNKSGGTMSGNIVMGDNDVTGINFLQFTSGTYLTDVSSNYVKLNYASSGAGGIIVYDGDSALQGYLYADGASTPSFGLLTGAGQWGVRTVKNGLVELRHNNVTKLETTSGGVTVTGHINTTSGDIGSAIPSRIYTNNASSGDAHIRYADLSSFRSLMNVTAKATYQGREQSTTDTNYWVGTMGWGSTDFDTIWHYGSGHIESWSNPTNAPSTETSHWTGHQSMHYTDGSNQAYGHQFVVGAGNPAWCYLRGRWGTSATSWAKMWNSLNDGSGSGLDADKLDGVQGSSFLRSDATDTATGALTLSNQNNHYSGHHYFDAYDSSGNHYPHYLHGTGSSSAKVNIRVYNAGGGSYDLLYIAAGSNDMTWRGNKIWNAGNDGSGSGLDADTVDGIQGSSFLRSDTNDTSTGGITTNFFRTNASTTSYSLITRNTGASNYVLYVQSPNSGGTQKIATFRYGSASAGGGTEVMKIARGDCNIYNANLTVSGSITGSSKNFSIKHPTKEGKRLIHSCIEGPEVAVYFRGRSKSNTIEMPDYWGGLVDLDSMTVELTAIGPNQDLYVEDIADDGEVTVGSNTETSLNYFYVVYGERKDIDKLEIEIEDTGEVEGEVENSEESE